MVRAGLSSSSIKQDGSNSVQIAKEIRHLLPQIQSSLPSDVKVGYLIDTSDFIVSTVNNLKDTIFITFIIVMLVVFVFLGRWRATFHHCADDPDLPRCLVHLPTGVGQYTEHHLPQLSLHRLSVWSWMMRS